MKQTSNVQLSTPKAFASKALNTQPERGSELGVGRSPRRSPSKTAEAGWMLSFARFLSAKK
jgi:hypothetical protein